MIYILLISIVLSLVFGKVLISAFQKKNVKQSEREDGPESHFKKSGTPTMGGVFVILAIIVSCLLLFVFKVPIFMNNMASILILLVFSLAFGAIGFYDDYLKVNSRSTEGLRARDKMLLLTLLSIVFVLIEVFLLKNPTSILIPFINTKISVNLILYMLLSIIVILSTPNAVNLTDGIDGLASSVGIGILVYFFIVSILDQRIDIALFTLIVMGAYIGFLFYNWHKAKVFMGDTGSFFLGGTIALIAIALGKPLYLLFICIIPVIETLSVIIQVLYFRKTGGKRIFKMTPYHHHLELSGWKEESIVLLFTTITLIMGAILILFKIF